MHQIEPESEPITTDDDSLYPYVNKNIEYGLFEDIVDSYYLDSQIKDDFQCDHDCYSQYRDPTNDSHSNACTHDYQHITQSVQDLTDSTQQNTLHSMEKKASHLQMIPILIVTLALQTIFWIQKMQMIHIHVSCQNIPPFNHIPYQTIEYNDNGMFTTKLMNDTATEIFIDNSATPSILPLHTYNRFPILQTYPKTESNTPIHTGGGLITSHFWLEIPLKLQHQTIQIKALVCDSECPYDLILG